MLRIPFIVSVQTGPVRELGTPGSDDPMERPWTSGFYKLPVDGPVRVWAEGLIGDGQADLVNHGGPDKAVLGYAASSYRAWAGEVADEFLVGGAFGENLTIEGQSEADVCIGDVVRIGAVTLEVSQPRQPCWKLGRRFRDPQLPTRVVETGRSGWYFRVREVGDVRAGDAVALLARPHPHLTIVALNEMLYGRRPIEEVAVGCEALSDGWRRQLGRLLARSRRAQADDAATDRA